MKTIKKLETPLYLLIIALLVYETSLVLSIALVGVSLVRLVLNSMGFDQFYDELSGECKETKNR
tara:strand:+ start:87 stop:278 length:192 start_codon:yes stop_codon:yes gene_type:complete